MMAIRLKRLLAVRQMRLDVAQRDLTHARAEVDRCQARCRSADERLAILRMQRDGRQRSRQLDAATTVAALTAQEDYLRHLDAHLAQQMLAKAGLEAELAKADEACNEAKAAYQHAHARLEAVKAQQDKLARAGARRQRQYEENEADDNTINRIAGRR